jgi:hypothetical protein
MKAKKFYPQIFIGHFFLVSLLTGILLTNVNAQKSTSAKPVIVPSVLQSNATPGIPVLKKTNDTHSQKGTVKPGSLTGSLGNAVHHNSTSSQTTNTSPGLSRINQAAAENVALQSKHVTAAKGTVAPGSLTGSLGTAVHHNAASSQPNGAGLSIARSQSTTQMFDITKPPVKKSVNTNKGERMLSLPNAGQQNKSARLQLQEKRKHEMEDAGHPMLSAATGSQIESAVKKNLKNELNKNAGAPMMTDALNKKAFTQATGKKKPQLSAGSVYALTKSGEFISSADQRMHAQHAQNTNRMVAPTNDDCASVSPVALTNGVPQVFTGTTLDATADGPFFAPTVWHEVTLSACTDLTISYCGNAASIGVVWAAIATECPVNTGIINTTLYNNDCNDNSYNIIFDDLPAGNYWIPVLGDYSGNTPGPYSITVTAASCTPVNDDCSAVSPVVLTNGVPQVFTGNTDDATPDGIFYAPSVWHEITLTTCSDLTISYCGNAPNIQTVWLTIATECPISSTGYINTTISNNDCFDNSYNVFFDNLPAGNYWIPVIGDYGGNTPGPYSITVTAQPCTPVNDDCSAVSPVVLTNGVPQVFTGTTNDATPDGIFYGPSVWHEVTLTACSDLTISYCGNAPDIQTVWLTIATDCPISSTGYINTTLYDNACSDNSYNVYFENLPAGNYWIPVLGDYGGNIPGPYSITVTAQPCIPANDNCADVTPVPLTWGVPQTFTGTTRDATPDGGVFTYPTVWHAVTLSGCSNLSVSYCGNFPNITLVWSVLSTQCPPVNVFPDPTLIPISSYDVSTCVDNHLTLYWENLPAGTYYIPVMGDDGGGNIPGPYSIVVETVPCPPVNDDCASVTPVPLNVGTPVTFTGTTVGATSASDGVFAPYYPTVWHAFTLSTCATVTLDYCATSPAFESVWLNLSLDCTPTTTILADSYTTCGNNWVVVFNNIPAGTYWIPVLGEYPPYNAPGPYILTVTASLPPNDECSSTTPVALTMNTPQVFTGNTKCASPDGPLYLPTVFHEITTTECSDLTANYCGTPTFQNSFYVVLSTQCPVSPTFPDPSYIYTYDITDCGDGNAIIVFHSLPAGTYWLPVGGDPEGPYSITVTAVPCPPPNDDCASVTPVPLNVGTPVTFTGTTYGATVGTDGVFYLPTVWHAITLSTCATVTLDYCATSPAFESVWLNLSLDCSPTTTILADSYTLCNNNNNWVVVFNNVPAGTYWIPVLGDYPPFNTPGPYSLTVTASLPPNDECSSTTPVVLTMNTPQVFTGNTKCASPDGPLYLPTVFHEITTTGCSDLTVNYCGTPTFQNSFYVVLSTQCPVSPTFPDPSYIYTPDIADCGDGNAIIVFHSLPAGTYWLPVGGDPEGPYSITVTAVPCPPPNDDCASVTPVTLINGVPQTFTGTTVGATTDGIFYLPTVWHAITTTTCANITLDYCATTPAFGSVWLNLSLDCEPTTTILADSYTQSCGAGNDNWVVVFNNVPAGTYWIPVLGDYPPFNTSGPYSLTVTATLVPPTINTCAGDQTANANAHCQATVPDFTANVSATDNCSPASSLTITQSPVAGTSVGIGTTVVTITVTDSYGSTATCTVNFTVSDITPPVINTCASDQSANVNTNCQAAVPDFTAGVSASDNCGFTLTQSPAAGTLVGLGTTVVTITATDGSSNTASCTANFNVSNPRVNPSSITTNSGTNTWCYGQSVVLTANGSLGTAGGSFRWYEGGCGSGSGIGSSNVLSITPTAGTHTYYVRIEDACSNSPCVSVTVTVFALPVASPAVYSPVCIGSSITFSGNPPGMTSYAWTGPNGFVSSAQNPVINPVGVNRIGFYTLVVTDNHGCSSLPVSVHLNVVSCTAGTRCNNFRTQGIGAWGAAPHGSNAGTYLQNNFAGAFSSPNYLTIGCNNKMKFTSSAAIRAYLPCGGTPAVLPAGTLTNPGCANGNTFASQVVALTLNVRFDLVYANFSQSAIHLEDLIVHSGTFAGWRVAEVLNEANRLIGGCGSIYTPSQMTTVLDQINTNYEDGHVNRGFLDCPPSGPARPEEVFDIEHAVAYPNPASDVLTVKFSSEAAQAYTLQLFDVAGRLLLSAEGKADAGINSRELNVNALARGVYILRVTSGTLDDKIRVELQ